MIVFQVTKFLCFFYSDLFYEDIDFTFSPFMNGDCEKIDELAMKDHKLILEKIESAFEVGTPKIFSGKIKFFFQVHDNIILRDISQYYDVSCFSAELRKVNKQNVDRMYFFIFIFKVSLFLQVFYETNTKSNRQCMMHRCPSIISKLTASDTKQVKRGIIIFLCPNFFSKESISIRLKWIGKEFKERNKKAKRLFKSFNWNYFTGIYSSSSVSSSSSN